jgi:hypothetical protein
VTPGVDGRIAGNGPRRCPARESARRSARTQLRGNRPTRRRGCVHRSGNAGPPPEHRRTDDEECGGPVCRDCRLPTRYCPQSPGSRGGQVDRERTDTGVTRLGPKRHRARTCSRSPAISSLDLGHLMSEGRPRFSQPSSPSDRGMPTMTPCLVSLTCPTLSRCSRRVAQLSEELGIERARIRGWGPTPCVRNAWNVVMNDQLSLNPRGMLRCADILSRLTV